MKNFVKRERKSLVERYALQHLKQKSIVNWYRGFSEEQLNICNELLISLRDDIEQGSVCHTRKRLHKLGLHPLPDAKQFKEILHISQGNDLAFLFFLWKAEYATTLTADTMASDAQYTNNEQLLLSAIAHLDMTTTMRALDHILPSSAHSKKSRLKQQHQQQHRQRQRQRQQQQQSAAKAKTVPNQQPHMQPRTSPLYPLPYFQPARRPKQLPIKWTWQPPPAEVYFPQYYRYNDNMYNIPNEKNRWFSYYQLQPSKRIVKQVLTAEVDRVIAKITAAAESADGDLCPSHTQLQQQLTSMASNVRWTALERCLQIAQRPGVEVCKRKERIVQQLEQQIDREAQKLQHYAVQQYAQVQTICGGKDTICKLCTKRLAVPCKAPKANLYLLLGLDFAPAKRPVSSSDLNLVPVRLLEGKSAHCKTVDTRADANCRRPVTVGQQTQKRRRHKSRSRADKRPKAANELKAQKPKLQQMALPESECPQKCPSAEEQADEEHTTSSSYFHASTLQRHFGFDYARIYDVESKAEKASSTSIEDVVHKYCIAALKNDVTYADDDSNTDQAQEQQQQQQQSPPVSLDQAITECAQAMLNASLTKRSTMKSQMSTISLQLHFKRPCKNDQDLKRFYKLPYIDPDDSQLLGEMLQAAMGIMCHDHRYVLAGFPNAHNLPVLREWIAVRYHKTYSSKELEDYVRNSFTIYDALQSSAHDKIPKAVRQLNRLAEVSYGYHDKLLSNARRVMNNYRNKLDAQMLEHTRLVWLAMHGYNTMQHQPHDPFFAYMTSRQIDILRRYIWKSTEFSDRVKVRNAAEHKLNET